MAITNSLISIAFNNSLAPGSFYFGSGTYFFKREADSENFITIRRIRIYYRDIWNGSISCNLTITGQNQDGSLNSITIQVILTGTNSKAIFWKYSDDFEITLTTPQLMIDSALNISIIKITLIGDSEQLPTI